MLLYSDSLFIANFRFKSDVKFRFSTQLLDEGPRCLRSIGVDSNVGAPAEKHRGSHVFLARTSPMLGSLAAKANDEE